MRAWLRYFAKTMLIMTSCIGGIIAVMLGFIWFVGQIVTGQMSPVTGAAIGITAFILLISFIATSVDKGLPPVRRRIR